MHCFLIYARIWDMQIQDVQNIICVLLPICIPTLLERWNPTTWGMVLMNKKEEFQYYLTRFLTKYMAGQRNLSQNTISSYAYTFKLLLNFFSAEKNIRSDKITLDKLTKDNIIGFLDWLEQTRGVTIASRNIRLAGIHSFIKYLQTEDPSHLFEYQKILSIKNKKHQSSEIPYCLPPVRRSLFVN